MRRSTKVAVASPAFLCRRGCLPLANMRMPGIDAQHRLHCEEVRRDSPEICAYCPPLLRHRWMKPTLAGTVWESIESMPQHEQVVADISPRGTSKRAGAAPMSKCRYHYRTHRRGVARRADRVPAEVSISPS